MREKPPTWAATAVTALRSNTGFTAHPTTGCYDGAGYSVSPYPTRGRTIDLRGKTDTEIITDIQMFSYSNTDLLGLDNHYVGGWHPYGLADLLTLDVAIITDDMAQAEHIRVIANQADYYDFEAGCSRPNQISALVGGAL